MIDPVLFCAAAALVLTGQPALGPPSGRPAQAIGHSGPEGIMAHAQLVMPAEECTSCNGSPLLCDKRYNEVVYPTTHGAMSCRDDHWLAANQRYDIEHQLADGIRALMLEVHYLFGKVYLARGNALLCRKPLAEGLVEIRSFMQSHPSEVVTLIFKSRVRAADMAAAFDAAGLAEMLYAHAPGGPFPTLKEMVLTGHRLVIFVDREAGAYPWYHSLAQYCEQTAEKVRQPEALSSRLDASSAERPLCILNHYLAAPLPSAELSMQVNYNPFFQGRAEDFVRQTGRTPNFVVVDYYHLGALFEVVDTLNGLPWPQRRQGKPLPDVQAAEYQETDAPPMTDEPSTLRPVVEPPQY